MRREARDSLMVPVIHLRMKLTAHNEKLIPIFPIVKKRTKTLSFLIAVSALFEGLKILIILKQSK